MDRIRNAIKQMARWQKGAFLGDLEMYVETGDAKALAKLKRQKDPWWSSTLTEGLPTTEAWTDEDLRFARGIHRLGYGGTLGRWVHDRCYHERPDQDYVTPVRESIVPEEADEGEFASNLILHSAHYLRNDQPTSVGRYFVGLSVAQLKNAIEGADKDAHYHDLVELLARFAPAKLEGVVDAILARPQKYGSEAVFAALLRADAPRYEAKVLAAYDRRKEAWTRFNEAQAIYEADPKKHADLAIEACRAALRANSMNSNHHVVGPWMVEKFGKAALPDLVTFFRRQKDTSGHAQIMEACAKFIGDAASVEVYLTALDQPRAETRLEALKHLVALGDAKHDDRIHTEIRRGFAETDSKVVVPFLQLAGRWKVERVGEDVWELLNHKSKPVREAAARALARAGESVIPRAAELLSAKKADARLAAITLLGTVGGPAAEAALEARADVEENDDVRDAILLAVQEARERRGIKPTQADIELRIKKAEAKAKNPAKWLDIARLPKLKWKDGSGGALSAGQVTYLLFRQSRAKEIVADVEAKPLYDQIDPESGGEFARAVLQAFLASKQEAGDRWALAVAGLLGDDRVVPLFARSIREWVESNRGKLAEWAVQALALLGTDAALLAVDALAIRYRNKMKNVGRAAGEAFEAAANKQGITPEELGDRVVPWLGFDPGKKRLLEAGDSKIEVSIGPDFKFAFRDLVKNKPIKALPKTVGPEVLSEFKDLSANLREVVKAQHLRLENLLVRQRRWPAARWVELFLKHPLLIPFATRLAWGYYDDHGKLLASFRALDDLSLTTPGDEEFSLPQTGQVGMLHPLELDEPTRQAWQRHIADYNIEPPFPQMDRRVVTLKAQDRETRLVSDYANKELNAMTFRSRAEKLGWHRGSVADGGTVTFYRKAFPAAGSDVLLYLDGMYMGVDMYASIKLQHVYFIKSGSVKIGSYIYDEPSDENDQRVLRLKDVPPIVYSESMGDLQQIAGTNASSAAPAE